LNESILFNQEEGIMILKRVGPYSCAKVTAVLYGLIGLIVGALFSLIAVVSSAIGNSSMGFLFGAGAIILLPLGYGALGFISGALSAWLYNVIVKWIGGIEVEFEQDNLPPQNQSPVG
jgi:hypothetical protein